LSCPIFCHHHHYYFFVNFIITIGSTILMPCKESPVVLYCFVIHSATPVVYLIYAALREIWRNCSKTKPYKRGSFFSSSYVCSLSNPASSSANPTTLAYAPVVYLVMAGFSKNWANRAEPVAI